MNLLAKEKVQESININLKEMIPNDAMASTDYKGNNTNWQLNFVVIINFSFKVENINSYAKQHFLTLTKRMV